MELYIWPHSWDLPSFDIDCLAITLYLQLAIHRHKKTKQLPHHYTLVECTDPDLSPSGTLPFLVHGSEKISTFTGIVRYLESVGLELDEQDEINSKKGEHHFSHTEGAMKRAKRVAWTSLVDSQLRDLVVRETTSFCKTILMISRTIHSTHSLKITVKEFILRSSTSCRSQAATISLLAYVPLFRPHWNLLDCGPREMRRRL
jgi:Outer mitochondrial membrane transport complex protein